jgi:hypothetical protein
MSSDDQKKKINQDQKAESTESNQTLHQPSLFDQVVTRRQVHIPCPSSNCNSTDAAVEYPNGSIWCFECQGHYTKDGRTWTREMTLAFLFKAKTEQARSQAERSDAPAASRRSSEASEAAPKHIAPVDASQRPLRPAQGQVIPERPTTQDELKKWNETYQPKPIKLIAEEATSVECDLDSLDKHLAAHGVWHAPTGINGAMIKCLVPKDCASELHWMDKPFISRDLYELHECQRDWYRFHNEVCIRFPWLLSHPPQPID